VFGACGCGCGYLCNEYKRNVEITVVVSRVAESEVKYPTPDSGLSKISDSDSFKGMQFD